MDASPAKSRHLHNMNLAFLKWGVGGGDSSSNATADRRHSPESDSEHDGLRPKRVGSRSTRIHRSTFSPPLINPGHCKEEPKQLEEEESSKLPKVKPEEEDFEEETVQIPWNLRPRKFVAETSSAAETKAGETAAPKSMRLRYLAENGGVAEKKEKKKFSITLTKDEIEEDIFAMTGSRPSRRPTRRPKNVQKQLDNVFPGLWMVGMSPETYRVADPPAKN